VSTETEGELVLEDLGVSAGVGCSGIFVGSVGPGGEDEVTAVLSLSGVEVTLAKPLLTCTKRGNCGGTPEVSPLELPWHSSLLEDGTFLDLSNVAGYEVICTILGVKVTDTCRVEDPTFEVSDPASGGAEALGLTETL
jgi:hypothetical protein